MPPVCNRTCAAVIVVIDSGDPFSPYSSPVSTSKLPHQRLTRRALYLDKRSDVDAYTAVMSRLEVVSVPPHQTVEFLSRILKEVDGA